MISLKHAAWAAVALLCAAGGQAMACEPHGTCIDIQWCMNPTNGKEFSSSISIAATKNDGNTIGTDTTACQNKYGSPGPTGGWGTVSAGCTAADFVALGKKALGLNPATCD